MFWLQYPILVNFTLILIISPPLRSDFIFFHSLVDFYILSFDIIGINTSFEGRKKKERETEIAGCPKICTHGILMYEDD